MDKNLYKYLLSLDFTDDDINTLIETVPGLEIISFERAIKNIKIVSGMGYPEEDIDFLISANPGFLCNDPEQLMHVLMQLGDDIEEKLKADPFLI